MAYCGCATATNQIRWGIFGLFMAIFIAFLVAFIVTFIQSINDHDDCMEPYEGTVFEEFGDHYCDDQIREEYRTKLLAFLIIFPVALIVSIIPLCVMCCCTSPPGPITYSTGTPIAHWQK